MFLPEMFRNSSQVLCKEYSSRIYSVHWAARDYSDTLHIYGANAEFVCSNFTCISNGIDYLVRFPQTVQSVYSSATSPAQSMTTMLSDSMCHRSVLYKQPKGHRTPKTLHRKVAHIRGCDTPALSADIRWVMNQPLFCVWSVSNIWMLLVRAEKEIQQTTSGTVVLLQAWEKGVKGNTCCRNADASFFFFLLLRVLAIREPQLEWTLLHMAWLRPWLVTWRGWKRDGKQEEECLRV